MTDPLAIEKLRSLHSSGQLKASLLAALPLLLTPMGNFTHYRDQVVSGKPFCPVAIYDIGNDKWHVRTGVFEVNGHRYGDPNAGTGCLYVESNVPPQVLFTDGEDRSVLIVTLGDIPSFALNAIGETLATCMNYDEWVKRLLRTLADTFTDRFDHLLNPNEEAAPDPTPDQAPAAEPDDDMPEFEPTVLAEIRELMRQWVDGGASPNRTLTAIANRLEMT